MKVYELHECPYDGKPLKLIAMHEYEIVQLRNALMLQALKAIESFNPHNLPMTGDRMALALIEIRRTARNAIAAAEGREP